jgi:hypothetical protein
MLEFNKKDYDSTLKIQVHHRDFLSGDDILGEYDVNLHKLQNLRDGAESEVASLRNARNKVGCRL